MGQNEIHQLLKRNRGKWMTVGEISKKIKVNSSNVSSSLKRMKKYDSSLCCKENYEKGGFLWKYI